MLDSCFNGGKSIVELLREVDAVSGSAEGSLLPFLSLMAVDMEGMCRW